MVLLLLLACAHRGPVRDSGETGAPEETGALGDTADANPHDLCGGWAGVELGSRWSFEPTDEYVADYGFDGVFTVEVASIVGDEVMLVQSGAYAGSSGEFTWRRTDTWRCDADGAWLLRMESATEGVSHGTPIATEGWRVFEPGWLVRPTRAGSWMDAFTISSSTNGFDPVVTEVTCDTSAVATDTWNGVGGPAEALLVTPLCSNGSPDPYVLAAGVGLVANRDEELVAYTR